MFLVAGKKSVKKINAKKVIAQLLAIGIVLTTLFPGTAYAAEVGEQVSETTNQITTVLTENSDLIEQAVIEEIQARGGDINDQALVDQVREEVRKKIENGELKLDEKTEEETTETTKDSSETSTEDTDTSSESVSVTDHTSADEILSDGNNSSKMGATRLIVTSDVELTEYYGAVTVDHYDNIYVLAYKSAEETESAYNSFVANGITVEKDASMDAIKEDEMPEDKVAKEVTNAKVTDAIDDDASTATRATESVEDHKTIVAVIDTGISDIANDDTLKDRVIEGTSTIGDSYVDDNGHGTAMAKIIAEDTADENVMLLPIKALDKDGKGTVLSVALAIKYAKEHGADVINLSLSGKGTSNILTNAISDCYNNGITVVTAAGNDNNDALSYMPGNIDTAINIAAADKGTDGNIIPATYTNHGDNIDFAALGTYKLVVEKEKTTLETELRGTSIASAHVAAYVALLKQINSTAGGVVNPVSESDVMESLIASADDFEGTINHTYFGNGFLAKENLVFLNSDVEDQDKETDADETEDDRNQKIEVATKKTIFIDQNHWWGFNDDNNWSAGGFDNAHPNGSPAQGLNVALAWFRGAGCDELEVCMMGNVQTYDSVFVPINMKLTIYGESIFSAGQKTWQRIGSGGDSPVIGGATSDNGKTFGLAYNEHTKIELHTVNIWDNTSTVVSFGDTPGAVSSPDIYAEGCSFFSENHWWSVGTSNGTFNKCTFDNTWGHNYNVGAIASWKYLTCTNCTFSGNGSVALSRAITYSGLLGGGLDCRGSMYIDGCTINNYGGWNTAIGCSGNVTIKNTTINVNKNTSSEDVGIIYGGAQSGQSITIDDCNVYNAGMEGIRIDNNDAKTNLTKASISNSTIHGCDTGIKVNTGTAAVSNCNIYSNKYGIDNRGTLNFKSGNVYNNNSTYPTNTQWAQGCGIINNGGTCNISGGTIRDNGWGNVWNNSGNMNISGGTISNKAGQDQTSSYGVWNNQNCTITGGNIYGYTAQNNNNAASAVRNCNTLTVKSTSTSSPNIYSSNMGIDTSNGTTSFEGGTIYSNTTGIYCNTGATVNVKGGTIKENKTGLYNAGTTTMSNGKVTKSTQMNVDVYDGTVNFNGGSITESGNKGYGIEIQNNGSATFNQSANIGINTLGGVRVWANGVGRYNVYKGATTAVGSNGSDVGVYLAAGASMTIHDSLTSDVKVASYDRYTGKVIANCGNEAIANSAAQHLKLTGNKSFQKTTLNTRKYADTYADLLNAYGYNNEALWNHYNTYGRNEGRAAEDCGKTVVYRKGNENTGAKTQIIVSQTEDTSFDTNLEANKLTDSRFSARIRTSDEFTGHKNAKWRDYVTTYWGEYNSPRAESIVYLDGKDVSKSIYNSGWATSRNGQKAYGRILTTYAGWYPTTLYAKYDTGYDPNANHNDIDKPEKDDGKDDILDPNPQAPEKKEDTKPDTPTPEGLSFYFNGNGQDEGVNYTVRHISTTYPMPDVTDFMKHNFSGQGFSVLKDATYKNTQEPTKVRKAGETVNTITLLNSLLGRNDCEVAVSDGNITVTQYVTWDAIPTVTMADKYWYYSEVRDMTDEEIIEQIKKTTHVMDKEDTNGQEERGNATSLKVEIEGLDRDCFDKLGEIGYTSVRGYVTDTVGNKAYATCKIHIVNAKSKNKTLDPTAGPLEASYYTYSRFIDKENYYKTKTVNGKVVPDSESGALQEDSIWYENEEYKKLIEDTLALEGTDQSVVSYEFDIHDLAASKHYCKVHFIGKFWGEDNLDNWYKQFITDARAKVSGTLPNNKKAE